MNCWQWINRDSWSSPALPPVDARVPLGRRLCSRRGAWKTLWKVLRRTDEPRMTRFLAAQLGTSHYFDITAARRDFGYVAANLDGGGNEEVGRMVKRIESAGG